MNRLLTAIALTGAIFVGTRALAVDSASQSTMSKRQMIAQVSSCMRKRMSTDKSTSYIEAMKECKHRLNKGSDDSPSGVLVASDSRVKP